MRRRADCGRRSVFRRLSPLPERSSTLNRSCSSRGAWTKDHPVLRAAPQGGRLRAAASMNRRAARADHKTGLPCAVTPTWTGRRRELLRRVLGSDLDQIVDLRTQRGVGADAIDELKNYYELKVSAGSEPDQVTLTIPRQDGISRHIGGIPENQGLSTSNALVTVGRADERSEVFNSILTRIQGWRPLAPLSIRQVCPPRTKVESSLTFGCRRTSVCTRSKPVIAATSRIASRTSPTPPGVRRT